MGSYPDEFPFGIMEVVNLLNLRIRRQQANSVYVDCPFCGDRRGRMNVNFVKNVWRCNHCDAHGGMLALYAELNHTTTSDAYWEIAEALCDNIQEEHARSGNEAQPQPVSTGSPSSGARAAAAGHSSSERKIVPQSDKASPAEIHQTLSNSIGVSSTAWPDFHTSLHCGSICREPKSSGVSAEAVAVEKSATDERADIALLKRASSSSLNDRIINFPSSSPPIVQTSPAYYLLECAGRIINRTIPTANNTH